MKLKNKFIIIYNISNCIVNCILYNNCIIFMSNSNCIPAKPTFGKMKPEVYASDYIKNKSITTILQNKKKIFSLANDLNFNSSCDNCRIRGKKFCYRNKCNTKCCNYNDDIDYTKLNINLITKEDLTDVTVIETFPGGVSPTTINPNLTTPFYQNYTIDPKGELFGNTCCGLNNYLLYRRRKYF